MQPGSQERDAEGCQLPFKTVPLQNFASERGDALAAHFVTGKPITLDQGHLDATPRKNNGGQTAGRSCANDEGVHDASIRRSVDVAVQQAKVLKSGRGAFTPLSSQ